MKPPKVLISSTGRSGSGFIYKVLTELGIPAGHESYFCFPWRRPKQVDIDSSWIATDQLDDYEGIVYHQVRHPLKVLTSIKATARPWQPPVSKVWAVRKRMMPEVTGDLTRDFMGMIWYMNNEIEKHANWRYRIEDIKAHQVQSIAKAAGYDRTIKQAGQAMRKVSTQYNNHTDKPCLTWEELPECKWKDKLRNQAYIYGY